VHGIEECALNIFIIDHAFFIACAETLKTMSSTLQGASKNLETFEVRGFPPKNTLYRNDHIVII
jgi:hypothetical protein